jgi:hypothetical protein
MQLAIKGRNAKTSFPKLMDFGKILFQPKATDTVQPDKIQQSRQSIENIEVKEGQ